MNHFVYILQSQISGRHYIGSTSNLERRLKEHNLGINTSTRGRGPFKIIYFEIFQSRSEAIRRELEIKSFKGGHKFKELLDRAPR